VGPWPGFDPGRVPAGHVGGQSPDVFVWATFEALSPVSAFWRSLIGRGFQPLVLGSGELDDEWPGFDPGHVPWGHVGGQSPDVFVRDMFWGSEAG